MESFEFVSSEFEDKSASPLAMSWPLLLLPSPPCPPLPLLLVVEFSWPDLLLVSIEFRDSMSMSMPEEDVFSTVELVVAVGVMGGLDEAEGYAA